MTVTESASGQYVRYTGGADERSITKADWRAVGIDHEAVRWDSSNAFHVPVEDISPDAWAFIDADDDLKLVKVDDPNKIRAMASGNSGAEHPLLAAARREAEERQAAAESGGGGSTGGRKATAAGGSTAGATTSTTTTTGGSTS